MKIDDYKLLLSINKIGTLRGTARQIHISQPALSHRLKQIEEYWGEEIFIRSHKKLLLTPVGEKILDFAKKMVHEEKELLEEISRNSEEVRGTLSLGVSSVVGQYILPFILRKFIETYPHVQIELQTGLSQDIKNISDQFHITIVRGNKLNDLICDHLLSDPLFLIYKKDHHFEDKQIPLIEFQNDPSFDTLVNEWLSKNINFNIKKTMKVDQIETCKQLMMNGLGMAILPETSIHNLDESLYHMERLDLNGDQLKRDTWICYSNKAKELPQVGAFLEMINVDKS